MERNLRQEPVYRIGMWDWRCVNNRDVVGEKAVKGLAHGVGVDVFFEHGRGESRGRHWYVLREILNIGRWWGRSRHRIDY